MQYHVTSDLWPMREMPELREIPELQIFKKGKKMKRLVDRNPITNQDNLLMHTFRVKVSQTIVNRDMVWKLGKLQSG